MIYYNPEPLELLHSDLSNIKQFSLPSGGFMRAEAMENNQIRVLDLVSTDPMDYLDERLQPGRISTLRPGL